MDRTFLRRTLGWAALFFLASCFGESTGPDLRHSRLGLAPRFANTHAARLVDFTRVRVVITRPNGGAVVIDTVFVLDPGDSTSEIALDVPVQGTSESFLLTMALIDAAGDTVFRSGPDLVSVNVNDLDPPLTTPVLRYVGTGFDAAGVRFVSAPAALFFQAAGALVAEAFDSQGVAIPSTPIVFELVNPASDSLRAQIPDEEVGQVVARQQRGTVAVRALLFTDQADTAAIAIQPLPSGIVIVSGNNQAGPVGAPLAQPVRGRVNAIDNLGVQGIEVTFTVLSGNGTLSQARDTTDANGDFEVIWTLGGTLGGQSLSATATGVSGATINFAATAAAGAATSLAFTVPPSNVTPGGQFAPAIAVTARDQFGNPAGTFAGLVTIAFAANPGGAGTLTGVTTVNAVNGVATFTGVGLNGVGTGFTLEATSAGLLPDTSNTFNTTVGPPAQLAFQVQPANTQAGAAITPDIVVLVQDASGITVPNATNPVTLAIQNNPAGGTLGGTLTVNAVNGVATFPGLTVDKAGTGYTLQATAPTLTGTTSASFDVTSGPAQVLVLTTQPSASVTAGAVVPLTVEARDALGNLATGFSGTVTVAIAANPASGTLGGAVSAGAVGGIATLNGFFLDKAGSGYTLAVSAAAIAPDTTTAFAVAPAPATTLSFGTQPPASVVAGTAMTVTVEARDNFANLDTAFSGTVALALSANPGGGTLGGTLAVGAVNGVASFTDPFLDKVGVGYALQATAGALLPGGSSALTVTPAAAAVLAVTTQPPPTATAGAALTVVVAAQDAFGNVATTFTGPVTIALGNNPGGATLGGTLSVNAVAGVATFADPFLDKTGTGYTLALSAGGLSGTASGAFDVGPAAASQLVLTQAPPASTEAGLAIAPGMMVEVRDAFGNLVTTFAGTVDVALDTNPGGSTLSGTLSVPPAGGVATFADLRLNKASGGYRLAFTAGALAPVVTGQFTVDPGPASVLVFTTEPPTSTLYGAPFAVGVTAVDSLGNVATTFGGQVTVGIGSNPSGGTLGGPITQNAVSGVANFGGLTIDNIGSPYVLSAAATGLGAGASQPMAVIAPATVHAWINVGGGNWTTPSNWSQGVVPGPTDTVEIKQSGTYAVVVNSGVNISGRLDLGGAAGTQTLDIQGSIFTATNPVVVGARGRLLVSGGTVTGTGLIEVFGQLEWSGGGLSGGGFGGTTVVRPGGQLTLSGATSRLLSDYVLENQGTAAVTGAFIINSGNVGIIRNAPGGTFAWDAAAQFQFNQGGTISRFDNDGAFTANPGAGQGTITAAFDNAGTVTAQTGTLALNGGGVGDGTYTSGVGAVLLFGGGTHTLNAGSLVDGPGEVRVGGGTVDAFGGWNVTSPTSVQGGALYYNGTGTTGTLVVSSGTLGGNGLLQVSGAMTWSGGNLQNGTGATRVLSGGTLAISGAATRTMTSYGLEVAGAGTWTGTGQVNSGSAAAIRVLAGGTLDIQGDPQFLYNQGGGTSYLAVEPGGTVLRTTSAGMATISSAFDNDGQATISSGTLRLAGSTVAGDSLDGVYTANAGATLEFNAGGHALSSTSAVNGAGTVLVSGSATVAAVGPWTVSGTVQVTGGTLGYNAPTGSTQNLAVSGGVLAGTAAGLLSVTNAMTWSGGNLAGTGGRTLVNGGATLAISGAATRTFTSYTLELAGTGVWAGTGQINSGSAATIRVLPGATLDIQGDPQFLDNQGGTNPVLDVQAGGTLLRTTSAGVAIISATTNNDGLTSVSSGTLRLAGGTVVGDSAGGTYSVGAGAVLDFNAGTHNLNAASLVDGAGEVRTSGGTLDAFGGWNVTGQTTVAGGSFYYNNTGTTTALVVSSGVHGGTALLQVSGAMTWSGGNLTNGGGATRVLSGGTLAISGAATRTMVDFQLELAGTGVWAGTGQINSGSAATIRVLPGATLDIQGDPQFLDNQGGANPVLDVQAGGTLLRTTSAGVAVISATTNNDGLTSVSSGTLQLAGGTVAGDSAGGTYTVNSPGTLDFSGGTHVLGTTGSLGGSGVVQVSAGTVSANGNWSHGGTTQVSGGTLNYSAAGGSTAFLDVLSGTLGGAAGGLLSVANAMSWTGGSLVGSGGSLRVLSGATLGMGGTASRSFINYVLEVEGTGSWNGTHNINSGSGAILRVLPAGSLDISADPQFLDNQGGATPQFENLGSVTRSASAGAVVFSVPFVNSGNVAVGTGSLQLVGGGTLGGAMTLAAGATTMYGAGTFTLLDTFSATGQGFSLLAGGTLGGLTTGETATFDYLQVASGSLQQGTGGTVKTDVFFAWTGGTLQGGGTTLVPDTATASFTGTAARTLLSHVVDLFGTAAWGGDFNVNAGVGGQLRIRPGATMALTGTGASAFLDNQGGTPPVLDVQGGMVVAGGGSFTVSGDLLASGTIDVTFGTLTVTGTSAWSGATTVASGSLLNFGGGTATLAGAANWSGAGEVRLDGGAFTGNVGDVATFERLHLLTGTQTHDGTVNVTADLTWDGSAQLTTGGTTRLLSPGTFTMGGSADRLLSGAALEIAGTGTWTGSFNVNAGVGAVWQILPGGTLDIQGDGSFLDNQGGASPVFVNQGNVTRSTSAGTVTITAQVIDTTGSFFVQTGTVTTGGGGRLGGTGLLLGGVFEVNGGTMSLKSGMSASSLGGLVRLTSGTITVDSAGPQAFLPRLDLVAGTLGHEGTLELSAFNWDGGTVSSNTVGLGGTTRILAGGSFVINAPGGTFLIGSHTVENLGSGIYAGAGNINAGQDAEIRIGSSGSFDWQGDGQYLDNQGGNAPRLVNFGSLQRSVSANPAVLGAFYVDTASVGLFVNTGRLQILGGARLGGTPFVAAGAFLDIANAGTTSLRNGFGINGTGRVTLNGGLLTLDSAATATIPRFDHTLGTVDHKGLLVITTDWTWASGTYQSSTVGGGGGTSRLQSGGTATFSGAGAKNINGPHLVWNLGTMIYAAGAGNINTGNAAAMQNQGLFDWQGDGQILHNLGGAQTTFQNASPGILRRSTSANPALLDLTIDQTGTIDVQTGTLRLTAGSGANFRGTFTAAAGALLELAGGTFTETPFGPITFTGDLLVSAGTLVILPDSTTTVTGQLSTTGTGTITMNTGGGLTNLTVGSASFGGGSTTGLLTVGNLNVLGDFAQVAGGSTSAFAPSGTFRTRFSGSGTQNISFASGVTSFFDVLELPAIGHNVVLQTNASVNDTLVMLGGGSAADLIGADSTQRLAVNVLTMTISTTSPRLAPPVLLFGTTSVANVNAGMPIGRGVEPDTALFINAIAALPVNSSIRYNHVRVSTTGAFALASDTIAGNLVVTQGNATFGAPGTFRVNGKLLVSGTGALGMTNAGANVVVVDSAIFGGGSTSGLLTAGTLNLLGDFVQGGGNAAAFAPTGNHVTVLGGLQNTTVSFANPTTSFFDSLGVDKSQPTRYTVTLLTDARANGGMTIRNSSDLVGPTARLTVSGGPLTTVLSTTSPTISNLLALELSAAPTIQTSTTADTIVFNAGVTTLPVTAALTYRSIRLNTGGAVTMANDTISADLDIASGSAVFNSAGAFRIGGRLRTRGTATLSMTNAARTLEVLDSAVFFGGSTAGLLTAGTLRLFGSFQQGGVGGNAYQASAAHITEFAGAAVQGVSMPNAGSGAANSRFGMMRTFPGAARRLALGTDIRATYLHDTTTVGNDSLFTLGATLITVDSVNLINTVFDRTRLALTHNTAFQGMNNVRFQNMDPATDFITAVRDGIASTWTVNFLTTPTGTGRFVRVSQPVGSTGGLTITSNVAFATANTGLVSRSGSIPPFVQWNGQAITVFGP